MNDFYIYNIIQAQFFLDCGLCPIGVGRGKKGDFYLKFIRNPKSEEIFSSWVNYINKTKN